MPAPDELPEAERDDRVQHPHADDRPHGRRQPVDLHRPVRRPARPAAVELLQDATTPTAPPTRPRRSRTGRARWPTPRRHPDARRTTTSPSMVYSDTVPASGPPNRQTPAPWVPFTRAGCDVGDFSTANMVLENAKVDIPTIFGADSPEVHQFNADPDSLQGRRDRPTTSARPCTARRAPRRAPTRRPSSSARRRRRRRPSPTRCPPSRRVRTATRRSSAHKYVAPQLGAGTPNLTRHGFPVTNAHGNLIDLNGVRDHVSAFTGNQPGFPGFSPTASPVARHDGRHAGDPGSRSPTATSPTCTSGRRAPAAAPRRRPPAPASRSAPATSATRQRQGLRRGVREVLRSGSPQDGINAVQHAVRDQRRGERPVRRRQRRPRDHADPGGLRRRDRLLQLPDRTRSASSRPTSRACSSTTASAGTTYDVEPQGASIYAHGQPGLDDPTLRQLERDTASDDAPTTPTAGRTNERIVKYQAGGVGATDPAHADRRSAAHAVLHAVPGAGLLLRHHRDSERVDQPRRSPTTTATTRPNIDVTWSSFAGPGVADARDRRADAGAEQRGAGPELDEHRARGLDAGHLGRGGRPAADHAVAARAPRRLHQRWQRHLTGVGAHPTPAG